MAVTSLEKRYKEGFPAICPIGSSIRLKYLVKEGTKNQRSEDQSNLFICQGLGDKFTNYTKPSGLVTSANYAKPSDLIQLGTVRGSLVSMPSPDKWGSLIRRPSLDKRGFLIRRPSPDKRGSITRRSSQTFPRVM
ncbi:hypothetical protein Fot_42084 [Forsythia ovata]|uniref:Uncharacterized protein n=1 Tax=Forsythia ovata TaxID=205694 RepID=A0ABD1RK79_9LAMI